MGPLPDFVTPLLRALWIFLLITLFVGLGIGWLIF